MKNVAHITDLIPLNDGINFVGLALQNIFTEHKISAVINMSFNKSNCIIRKTYCGDSKVPKDTATQKYSRKGTRHECLKKGFGIADWKHRNKTLSKTSLQQIIYIGPIFETNFKKKKIYSITSLMNKLQGLSTKDKRELIASVCKRKNGGLDQRAFNSVILFLHERGVKNLPSCKIVKE